MVERSGLVGEMNALEKNDGTIAAKRGRAVLQRVEADSLGREPGHEGVPHVLVVVVGLDNARFGMHFVESGHEIAFKSENQKGKKNFGYLDR